MGDWTPANVIAAGGIAFGALVALVNGVFLRGNTRLAAFLKEQADAARERQERQDADRAAQATAEEARARRLDDGTADLIAGYRAEVQVLREELRQMRDAHRQEIADLRAEYDRRLADQRDQLDAAVKENRLLRQRIADLEHAQRAGGAPP